MIANISYDNPNAYHYEMANSEAAIKEALPRIASYRECRFLYVATHGDWDGLHLLNEELLSRIELRNLLARVHETKGSKLRGIHLGSCLFTMDRLANFLFEKDVGVTWIAGYSEHVDWIESSALDLLFFNELLKFEAETDLAAIKNTAAKLKIAAPGLIEHLGFGIFVKGRGGRLSNLLAPANVEDQDEG